MKETPKWKKEGKEGKEGRSLIEFCFVWWNEGLQGGIDDYWEGVEGVSTIAIPIYLFDLPCNDDRESVG